MEITLIYYGPLEGSTQQKEALPTTGVALRVEVEKAC